MSANRIYAMRIPPQVTYITYAWTVPLFLRVVALAQMGFELGEPDVGVALAAPSTADYDMTLVRVVVTITAARVPASGQ